MEAPTYRSGGPARLPYLFALPSAAAQRPLSLVVSVHGYTRQPLAHWQAFAERVGARGAALLVPWFAENGYRQYQQLVRPRRPDRPQRADLALIEAVGDAASRHGVEFDRWLLFGHSGGAQFAHRFALTHPERVAALGLSAAGWYTLPTLDWPYPYGLAGVEGWLGRPIDIDAFLRLPVRVWVGRRDRRDHVHLRQDAQVLALLGAHRLQRARRWVRALRAAGDAHGKAVDVHLRELPRTGHDFEACVEAGLADEVLAHFDAVTGRARPRADDLAGPCRDGGQPSRVAGA